MPLQHDERARVRKKVQTITPRPETIRPNNKHRKNPPVIAARTSIHLAIRVQIKMLCAVYASGVAISGIEQTVKNEAAIGNPQTLILVFFLSIRFVFSENSLVIC